MAVFGEAASTVREIVSVLDKHRDAVRGTYRARYVYDAASGTACSAPRLERPAGHPDNPATVIDPFEQIFCALAVCAGSDYPMLAKDAGIDLRFVDFTAEGLFDLRGKFMGLEGLEAPADARRCFVSLHLRAELRSSAPRSELEKLHRRVISYNMVLGTLRNVHVTDELVVRRG